jgi:uncharacterized protein YcfJ
MLKKTILATLMGTMLASGAAFADGPRYRDYGHRDVVVKRYYPVHRPVVVQRHYHPAPVVVHRQVVVQRPAPVYYYRNDAGLAILAGAVIGGAIAYQIANH